MRITLDITPALHDRTGVGLYVRETARGVCRELGPECVRAAVHRFRRRGWRDRAREVVGPDVRIRASRIPHRLLLESWRRFPRPALESLFGECSVFHGTSFLVPPARRARTVVTIHDLTFLRHPEIPVPHRYERYIRRSVSRADRVIAVSDATRQDVIEQLGIDPGRVTVVYEGAPDDLPGLPPEEFEATRRRLAIPSRYFLFVGTLEPRKNLVTLLGAWQRSGLAPEIGLVLAGRPGWASAPLEAALRKTPGVVRTGFVSEPLRNSLYRSALGFVFPSLYEGFGLPLLEAFVAGTPVLTSDRGALPEVAGDAALIVNPEDEEALSDGLLRLATDSALARDLAARGHRRAAGFNWERSARETVDVYRLACG